MDVKLETLLVVSLVEVLDVSAVDDVIWLLVVAILLDVVLEDIELVVDIVAVTVVVIGVVTVVPLGGGPPPSGGSRWRMKLSVDGLPVTRVPTASPLVLDRKESPLKAPRLGMAGVRGITFQEFVPES